MDMPRLRVVLNRCEASHSSQLRTFFGVGADVKCEEKMADNLRIFSFGKVFATFAATCSKLRAKHRNKS
jgi:hypothetical protein